MSKVYNTRVIRRCSGTHHQRCCRTPLHRTTTTQIRNLFLHPHPTYNPAEAAEAIPELLRLCDLEVRIPRLEVVALEKLAARDGKSVDAVLSAELRDLVSAQSEWLASVIPGSASGLSWPY
ncbi:MAG TPA: hypothetical protein VNN08_21575 [Thermoanaerobaculia bacterium]|nr:hypothetical protein [Thermoanaerobaculia bacterium]